jgi:hypothetical protein
VFTDHRIGRADTGQRPADGLAHGHPGPLVLIGKRSCPPAQAGRMRELGDEPVALGLILAAQPS